MKNFDQKEMIDNGFTGFKTIAELMVNKNLIPKENGVYLILCLEKECKFLEIGTGGFFKGKDPNVNLETLEQNWVNASNIVYIGKATDLQKRLNQYFNFGNGKNVGHYGGRLIWQLENSKNLQVCWKVTSEDPRIIEAELIQKFSTKFGKRPFANLVG
ncbi:MAG: GIY-YIG nuclease family protein [Flavobacteriales bacterium]|jgi:GIY-YIG catalytic domain.|nr:GIY-YIG nuclease family protein [Flavobacteriales bacterium]MCA0391608.1 GIY-YIG nuclease family protein [Bacteroidota bacterium]